MKPKLFLMFKLQPYRQHRWEWERELYARIKGSHLILLSLFHKGILLGYSWSRCLQQLSWAEHFLKIPFWKNSSSLPISLLLQTYTKCEVQLSCLHKKCLEYRRLNVRLHLWEGWLECTLTSSPWVSNSAGLG